MIAIDLLPNLISCLTIKGKGKRRERCSKTDNLWYPWTKQTKV